MKKFYEQCEINVTKLTDSDVITESGVLDPENYFNEELPLLPSGIWE